jgi:deoxyribonuclease V
VGSIAGLGLLVVDGYADLDPDGRPGLGAQCARRVRHPRDRHSQDRIPHRHSCRTGAAEDLARPVFVTAAGMRRVDAAALVRLMAGRFRVPDALRRADQLARTGPQAAVQRSHHPG